MFRGCEQRLLSTTENTVISFLGIFRPLTFGGWEPPRLLVLCEVAATGRGRLSKGQLSSEALAVSLRRKVLNDLTISLAKTLPGHALAPPVMGS